jgi:hypothetical protein
MNKQGHVIRNLVMSQREIEKEIRRSLPLTGKRI